MFYVRELILWYFVADQGSGSSSATSISSPPEVQHRLLYRGALSVPNSAMILEGLILSFHLLLYVLIYLYRNSIHCLPSHRNTTLPLRTSPTRPRIHARQINPPPPRNNPPLTRNSPPRHRNRHPSVSPSTNFLSPTRRTNNKRNGGQTHPPPKLRHPRLLPTRPRPLPLLRPRTHPAPLSPPAPAHRPACNDYGCTYRPRRTRDRRLWTDSVI